MKWLLAGLGEFNGFIINRRKFQAIIVNGCKDPDALYITKYFKLIDSLMLLGAEIVSKLSFDKSIFRTCNKLGVKQILLTGFQKYVGEK